MPYGFCEVAPHPAQCYSLSPESHVQQASHVAGNASSYCKLELAGVFTINAWEHVLCMLINHSVDCIVGMTHSHELHAECKPVPVQAVNGTPQAKVVLHPHSIPTALLDCRFCFRAGSGFVTVSLTSFRCCAFSHASIWCFPRFVLVCSLLLTPNKTCPNIQFAVLDHLTD